MGRNLFAKRGLDISDLPAADFSVSVARLKGSPAGSTADKADETRSEDDQWEGGAEQESRDECPGSKGYHGAVPDRPTADTKNRFEHDRQNRGFQSKNSA